MLRVFLPSLTLLAFFANPFTIRADDELDRITGKGQVALQKWTRLVDEAIAQSKKKERIDPFEAKDILKDAVRNVRNTSDGLTDEQRTQLVNRLNNSLNLVEDQVRRRTAELAEKNAADQPKKPASAPSPGRDPVGLAKDFIGSAKGAQDSNREMIARREKNVASVNLGIDKGPVYPTDEKGYVYGPKGPPKAYNPNPLSAKEVALLKTLNSVMSVNYDGDKFRAVIEHIQDKTGLTLIIDEGSMQDAKVEYDDPVTFKGTKVTVRTILKKVLGDKGLTYVIKEAGIQVMTPKKASEILTTRTYPISDLVAVDPRLGPIWGQYQKNQNAAQLINLITSTIEPSYWSVNGGPGTISFYNDALVVRASAEMHYQLRGR